MPRRNWRQACEEILVSAQSTRRLEINEDPAFQQRDWRIQRVGWAILALIIAVALAGLLGPGPLSGTMVSSGKTLEVEYQRFLRHGSQSELLVKVDDEEQTAGEVRIAISRDYLDALDLQQVTPSPILVQAAGQSVVYVFARVAGSGPMQVKFAFEPDKLGAHSGRIAVAEDSRVLIRQFTYP